MQCDVLIVGAGFAGLTAAERLSSFGYKCLLLDKRDHIGGNAYDYVDEHGVLCHKYGPHLFHTNSYKVFEYLSRFTEWLPAQYTAKSYIDGRLYSFPVNLETFVQIFGSEDLARRYLADLKPEFEQPKNAAEALINRVGRTAYRMFFEGYTRKMWGRPAETLDASLGERLPVRRGRNDRYFEDKWQCMPAEGYTKMFEKMLAASQNVKLQLNTDFRLTHITYRHLVYTGPIDEFFGYRYGKLPYRTLRFVHEHRADREFSLPAPLVTFPNEFRFTRASEVKHVTGQHGRGTTVVFEYPEEATAESEPYYPVPSPEARTLYQRYRAAEEGCPNVTFVGRLARYQYLNMDQVVAQALRESEKVLDILR
jgi:UDP-galactopyranose mutase